MSKSYDRKVYKPLRIYVRKQDLLAFDRDESEMRELYGRNWELINTLKDNRNLDDILPKLCRQYDIEDVILDFDKKSKFGWKYMSDEEKAELVSAIKKYRTGRPWEDCVKEKISLKMKGKSNFEGRIHSSTTKLMMSIDRAGRYGKHIGGLKWCHNPVTYEQKRVKELPEGFIWGRGMESKDYILVARSKRRDRRF